MKNEKILCLTQNQFHFKIEKERIMTILENELNSEVLK